MQQYSYLAPDEVKAMQFYLEAEKRGITKKEQLSDVDNLILRVFNFDYWYSYSDDGRVYRSGRDGHEKLKADIEEATYLSEDVRQNLRRIATHWLTDYNDPFYLANNWRNYVGAANYWRGRLKLAHHGCPDDVYYRFKAAADGLKELLQKPSNIRCRLFWMKHQPPVKQLRELALAQVNEHDYEKFFFGVAQTEEHRKRLSDHVYAYITTLINMITSNEYGGNLFEAFFHNGSCESLQEIAACYGMADRFDPQWYVIKDHYSGNGIIIDIKFGRLVG